MFFSFKKGPERSAIFFFNTLTRKKELFKPIKKDEVNLYSCGPTVYNYLHIGNLRAYVFADTVKRVLELNGYKVKHVMNVTDIGHLTSDADDGDDKMVKAIKREGKPMTLQSLREIADFYFDQAKKDFAELNIIPAEKYPFASDEIPEQIKFIQALLQKGFAYQIFDGIYFDTEKLPDYGRLGGISEIMESEEQSRIGLNSEKKNSRDFALWKFDPVFNESNIEGVKTGVGFSAPFGAGFPGWHIECSAMSMKYLGDQFDIHTGGIDHIPVHHNNEIAQSEALTGKLLANYWLHSNHLTISNGSKEEKMAKSGENFLTLQTLKEKNVSPLAYRYWLLTSKYSTRVDYSLEAIEAAQVAYKRLVAFATGIQETGKTVETYKEKFIAAVSDDLETPKAIALIWEMMKDRSVSDSDKKATILFFDRVLGLDLASAKKEESIIPDDIQKLLSERKAAKDSKDFAKADQIRKEIESKGFSIKDQKDGSQKLTNIN